MQQPKQEQQRRQQQQVQSRALDCGCEAVRRWEERVLCVVCMEKERDVALIPCGHVVLCERCCAGVRSAADEVREGEEGGGKEREGEEGGRASAAVQDPGCSR